MKYLRAFLWFSSVTLIFGVSVNRTAGAEPSLRDGLVAEWNFDEKSGLTAGDSAGDNDGELVNFPDEVSHWVTGKMGGAIQFSGGNYIEVPDAPAIGADVTEGLTVMAWFRSDVPLDASGAGNRMLEKGNNYFFLQGVRPGGMNFLVKHEGANFTVSTEESLEAGVWHHIAGVFDGETAKVYLNGELKNSLTLPGPIDDNGLPLRIGSDDSGSFFTGLMDQVLIWNRPLSADEIRAAMEGDFESPGGGGGGVTSIRDGLVAEWNFDEESGLTASDSAGDNDGELVNFPDEDSHWVGGKIGGAIQFSGDNYIEVPDAPAIGADVTGGLTVMAWFRSDVPLDAASAGNRMLEKGNNYFFLQGVRPGGMNFLVKNGGANFTANIEESLEAEVWYHIAGVFDGEAIKVYLDGELKNSVTLPGLIDDDKLPLRIGSDDGNSFFTGLMDQVLIWKRPLSPDEIRAAMEGDFEPPAGGAPEIIEQPIASTFYEGATAMLSVWADGAGPLRYLWFKGQEALRMQTESVLVLPYVSAADAGEYSVRVSNAQGETASASVALVVTPITGLETGQVAYWAFDEISGARASDGSGSELDGDLVGFGDTGWTSGKVANGLEFDGFGDFVEVPDTSGLEGLTGEATISFWIRPDTYGEEESAGSYDRSASYVLKKGNHLGIRVINDPGTVTRTLAVRAGTGGDNGSVTRKGWEANLPQGSVELEEWQHFVVVYRNGMLYFHKNGFPLGEPVEGNLGSPGDEALYIGNFDGEETALRYFDGVLDELAIWGRPLGEAEILEAAGRDVSGPPKIEVQPKAQKRLEGATADFRIVAVGKRPVTYQWLKNGEALEGADSERLILTDLLPGDAGLYSVRVVNDLGDTVSDAVQLDVEALDAITSGLAAYYSFDELDGETLADSSDNGLDGTIFNFDGDPIQDGVIGGAFAFDGEDDYVVIPHDDFLTLGSEATVSVWLNPVLFSGGSDFDRVFRKDVNYDFVLINGGIVRVHGISKTPYSSPGNTVTGEVWQHFAYVVKRGTIQWYLNGEAVGPALSGKLGEGNTLPLILGNYHAEPTEGNWINRPYQGLMDDLGIWQRALSPNDLLSIYQNGLNGNPLSHELEPIIIQSAMIQDGSVVLVFSTPYSSREHVAQVRESVGGDGWTDLTEHEAAEVGEGLYEIAIPVSAGGAAFYRIVSLSPPPLFYDDFESDVSGWTHGGDEDEWEHGTPVNGPGSAYSGTKAWGTDLDGNFEAHTMAYLRSPPIDLTTVSVANLSFVEYHNVDVEIEFHSVSVRVIDAESNEVLQEVFRAAGAVGGWTTRSIRLAGEAVGAVVRIEFFLETDDFSPLPGFYIDDVSVSER